MSTKVRSLVLRLPRKVSDGVNRRTILKSLFVLMGEQIHNVDYVSQQYNNWIWRITFKKEFDVSFLVGKKVNIGGVDVELEDFLEFNSFRYSTYKVMWLPHEFPLPQAVEFFKKNGDSVSVTASEEVVTEKDDGLPEIKVKTGNLLVKVKQKKDSKDLNILGIQNVSKHKCFVNKLGSKPKCLRCEEVGHIRKNCPRNSLTCKKCKKTGHVAEQCNMALATAAPVEELPDEDDTLEDAPKELEEATTSSEELENLNQENVTPAKINKLMIKMTQELESIEKNKRKREKLNGDDSSLRSLEQTPKTSRNDAEEYNIPIEDISISSSY